MDAARLALHAALEIIWEANRRVKAETKARNAEGGAASRRSSKSSIRVLLALPEGASAEPPIVLDSGAEQLPSKGIDERLTHRDNSGLARLVLFRSEERNAAR
jgi:hypothetical protein